MFYSQGQASSALLTAASHGNQDIVKLLINSGADINALDGNRETSLHKASYKGHKTVIEILISNGANIDAESGDGSTPLSIAALYHHQETAQLLIEYGAVINSDIAIMLENHELVKHYLDLGLDPNSKIQKGSNKGETYLLTAITTKNIAMVELLLNYGARLIEKNESTNVLPLHRASAIGCLDICRLLIANGTDINAQGSFEQTPLHLAVQYGHTDVVKLLVIHGANINVKNESKSTPLFAATYRQSLEIVECLLANGAEVNLVDAAGLTPLLCAFQKKAGGDEIIRLLVNCGANVNVRSSRNGCSPLHIAVAQNNKNIVEFLLDNGALEGLE
jgi:ankyrin repeat protein